MSVVLFLALSAPLFAEPTPDALARHFGSQDFNCYSLARPVDGLLVSLRHQYDPEIDHIGYDGDFYYDINLIAGAAEDPIHATGQCATKNGDISCGVACDSGQFTIKDAGIEDVLVIIERLADPCPDGNGRLAFDTEKFGTHFMLTREPDSTCEGYFRTGQ